MSIENNNKKICINCNRELVIKDNFYNSNNPIGDGKSPMCKKCIKASINYEDIRTVHNVLRAMDTPFVIELWERCSGKRGDQFGNYLRNLNLLPNIKHLTWEDSEFEPKHEYDVQPTAKDNQTTNSTEFKKKTFVVTDDIVDKWGEGYTYEQYRLFEKKYSKLIRNYGEKTELHTENLLNYIRFRVQEEISTAQGLIKDSKEWAALASKAAQDAKINVSQLSKSDISGGVDVLGQLFEAVESEVSVIPLLPKLLEQPYDDADMIIWANINYNRILEDKSFVAYRDIWNFYDDMLHEHYVQQNFDEKQIEAFKAKRHSVFRDLAHVYVEPLYESDGE